MSQPPILKTNAFTRFFLGQMTDPLKRNLLLSSFAARYAGVHPTDHAALSALNDMLSLANKASGIELPMWISSAIWQDGESSSEWLQSVQSEYVQDADIEDQARALVQNLPERAYYAGIDEMAQDFSNVIIHCLRSKPVDIALA
jgi:hypothetical protein